MVCRWAVVWTGSPDSAEDIAQTVLLRVDKALGSFPPEGRITTWVYRITKNVLIDHDRSRGQKRALHDRLRLEEIAKTVSSNGTGPLEAIDLLQHLMATLSSQQRASLDLVDLQGFSAQEAAEMLEVAPATVRVHLHRARQVLRSRVEGQSLVGGDDG